MVSSKKIIKAKPKIVSSKTKPKTVVKPKTVKTLKTLKTVVKLKTPKTSGVLKKAALKEGENYLKYIKHHKYKILTGALTAVGIIGASYYYATKISRRTISNTQEAVHQLIEDVKKDPETKNAMSDVLSQSLVKTSDIYVERVMKTVSKNLEDVKKMSAGDVLNTADTTLAAIQNGIASVMVPKDLEKINGLVEKINNTIIQNIETALDAEKISKIERYLISIGAINKNCTLYNNDRTPGDYPCDPEDKKKVNDKVLEYYSDKTLINKVNEYLDALVLKTVEEYLVNQKKIQANCTKNFYNPLSLYLYPCPDQALADLLIKETLIAVKENKLKL